MNNKGNEVVLSSGKQRSVYFIHVFSVIQSSGRRSRTASESSTHSGGRERSNSAVKQASPPPPSIPEQPNKEEAKKVKKDSPKKVHFHILALRFSTCTVVICVECLLSSPTQRGVSWLGWFTGKGKNEAHLPDDKNKSVSYSCSLSINVIQLLVHVANSYKRTLIFVRSCGTNRSRDGLT